MDDFDKRFLKIFDCLCDEDFGSALTLICPLVDGAGKKLYEIKKPGERFKKIIVENNDFLYWMLSGGVLIMNGAEFYFVREGKDNINLAQSIYRLVRNSLLHDAELSDEIEFVDEVSFGPVGGKITFPRSLIWGLAFMLSYLKCYAHSCPKNYQLSISGASVLLEEIWGDKEKVMDFFNKNLFKRNTPPAHE